MVKHSRIVTILFCISLTGCATPPEIKLLSTAQITYFYTAIEAVKTQSEALLLAARQISNASIVRINQLEKTTMDSYKQQIANLKEHDREENSKLILQEVVKLRDRSTKGRAKLKADLAAIKIKTEELQQYIALMKDVQVALDGYLQSEKAGEKILQDILKQPGVQNLLDTINGLIPKVTESATLIQELMNGLEEIKL